MKKDVTITNYEVLNDVLLVAFKEEDDVMIELKTKNELSLRIMSR